MNPNQFNDWLEHKSQSLTSDAFEKPLIMGVLNVTEDSFFDGGRFSSKNQACDQAFNLIAQGADIIDIGGESTKPGAVVVPLDLELSRVIPVIETIRRDSDIYISIDSYKPETMEAAIKAGANMINDIYALQQKGALLTAATLKVPVLLMHMQGHPQNMQQNPHYPNGVMEELKRFFTERIEACEKAGIDRKNLILDPGFGFGKSVTNNLQILYNLVQLKHFNLPLLLGVSRKSTIGKVLDQESKDRLIGGISLAVYSALKGVGIIRTHDVNETSQALKMIDAIYQAS